jgi:hypothetical protein
MYNSENKAETKAQQKHIIPFDHQNNTNGIRKKTMNQEERQNGFPKEKCTIVDFLLGKLSMGRMFSTGIFFAAIDD